MFSDFLLEFFVFRIFDSCRSSYVNLVKIFRNAMLPFFMEFVLRVKIIFPPHVTIIKEDNRTVFFSGYLFQIWCIKYATMTSFKVGGGTPSQIYAHPSQNAPTTQLAA